MPRNIVLYSPVEPNLFFLDDGIALLQCHHHNSSLAAFYTPASQHSAEALNCLFRQPILPIPPIMLSHAMASRPKLHLLAQLPLPYGLQVFAANSGCREIEVVP